MDAECIVPYSSGIPRFHLAHHNGSFWQNQAILCMLPHRCWVFLTFEVLCLTLYDEEMTCEVVCTISAVSRVILKLVYWFGIPNSTLKCSKVLISGVTFQCSLSQSQESDVLSYSECKIAKNFQGYAPGPLWGGLTVLPQTPWLHNSFSLCYTRWKNWYPQKIAGYATDYTQVVHWTRQQSKYLSSVMSCPFFPTGCRIHCHQCSTQWTCFQGRFAELENSDNFCSNAPYIPIVQYHRQSTLQVLVCQSKFFCLHQCICCIMSFLLFFLFSLCFQYLLMILLRASTNNFVFWCMVHTQTECAPNDKTDS